MSPTRPSRGPLTIAPVVLAVAFLVAGCSVLTEAPPAPTPADFQGIATDIVTRGITIDHIVSGDAGCNDPVLNPTAIGLDASGLDQAEPVRLYLYIFRNREVYERLRSSIDGCARSFVTDAETFEAIESSPFVLAGQGPWAPEFKATLREALTDASGPGDWPALHRSGPVSTQPHGDLGPGAGPGPLHLLTPAGTTG